MADTTTGCLKTKDGSTIKVVPLSNVQKRLRVEGDVKVLPDEIVDITNQRRGSYKKPRLPTPPLKEVIYSLPSQPVVSQPSSSTAFSAPSTSFVLIDPASLRQQDLPLNNLVYRSVQPMVTLPQSSVQTPMQSQQVPMQVCLLSFNFFHSETNIRGQELTNSTAFWSFDYNTVFRENHNIK